MCDYGLAQLLEVDTKEWAINSQGDDARHSASLSTQPVNARKQYMYNIYIYRRQGHQIGGVEARYNSIL